MPTDNGIDYSTSTGVEWYLGDDMVFIEVDSYHPPSDDYKDKPKKGKKGKHLKDWEN